MKGAHAMKHRRRPLPIPQHEFGFTPQAFNLFGEASFDAERLARKRAEAERARHAAQAAQTALFSQPSTHHAQP